MKNYHLLLTLCLLPVVLQAQQPSAAQLQAWVQAQLPAALQEHRQLVSIPNDAAVPADIGRNIAWLKPAFERRGFEVQLLETGGDIPVFFAERPQAGASRTLLLYLHLDGQPVDPAQWDQPDPWQPVLKRPTAGGGWEALPYERIQSGAIDPEWRVFGRAAADDKGPIIMLLHALDLMQQHGLTPACNLKVILDGEEEKGSAGLKSSLERYRQRYAADYLLIMDGPAHASNRPTLTFGCRGNVTCSITVYGPASPQHSGHFGNYAPNPVFRMAQLLASMKDEAGRVLIEGFYEGVRLDDETRALLRAVPDNDSLLMQRLGIASREQVGHTYQEALQYPSLNVRHIHTSWNGPGLKTIIPDWTRVHLDVRLVPETPADRQLDLIEQHLKKQGYYVIDREPSREERLKYAHIATFKRSSGVNAFRTDMEAPLGKTLTAAITQCTGETPVRIRIMGGTVPIAPMIDRLGIPAVIVPLVNMDNNQHNPNENLRIGNLIEGMRVCVAILTAKL